MPQQNGRAERKHQHVLNVARALLFQAHLPIKFYGDCVLAATHLINRTPSKLLNGKPPYEILYHQAPSYDHIRIFGTSCFVWNRMKNNDKFALRNQKCLFVGYPFGQKGWRVYDLETHEFFVSHDVIFHEHIFSFQKVENSEKQSAQDGHNLLLCSDYGEFEEMSGCWNWTQSARSSNQTLPIPCHRNKTRRGGAQLTGASSTALLRWARRYSHYRRWTSVSSYRAAARWLNLGRVKQWNSSNFSAQQMTNPLEGLRMLKHSA